MPLHFQEQHKHICDKYGSTSVTFKLGHTKSLGRAANQEKNPLWEIANPQTGEITAIILYCEPNEYCELCPMKKLEAANKVVSDLEKGIFPEDTAPETVLPKYFSLIVVREKPHLVYERRRKSGAREGLRMVLPANYILKDEIVKLKEKVEAKYGATAID